MVVCAYTNERWDVLCAALDSLAAQTVAVREVIVVIDYNDELLDRLRRERPEVRALSNGATRGLSGARNTGTAVAEGDIVAFLDDDAVAEPDWLERITAAYADPVVAAAGGRVRPNWLAGRPGWFPPEFDWVVGCTHSGHPDEPTAVRNLVGANMSFRRHRLLAAGRFDEALGRVGTAPTGCEETELCIRVGEGRPPGTVLYLPAAVVHHEVPPARATLGYFLRRCRAEGQSKARVSHLAGTDAGLEAERAYVRRTLPLGVLRGLGRALRGDLDGVRRAAAIVAGLAVTTFGYAEGQLARRRSERAVR